MKKIEPEILTDIEAKLAAETKKYVQIIKDEYLELIPRSKIEYLDDIKDFKEVVCIKQTNTISMFVRGGVIYFPLNAFDIISHMKKIPGFGIKKNHITCEKENIIENDNTFSDYIKHVFLSGLTPQEFYEETLLHETIHLCGVGGASPLREGIAELKTRELAQKYDLKTSACGYPKELKIALELQNIFGESIVNEIAFAINDTEIIDMLDKKLGTDAADFYVKLSREMNYQFSKYQVKEFSGLLGPIKKLKEYDKIDYSSAKPIIDSYKSNIKKGAGLK